MKRNTAAFPRLSANVHAPWPINTIVLANFYHTSNGEKWPGTMHRDTLATLLDAYHCRSRRFAVDVQLFKKLRHAKAKRDISVWFASHFDNAGNMR